MADLVYDTSQKLLSRNSKNKSWNAVSGPFGKGVLPKGLYDIGRREVTGYSTVIDPAYRDKSGKGFFVPIYPTFQTNRGKSGGRLGIHPDGNKPGTLGCIGLTDDNTKSFHDTIASTSPSAKLTLQVK